MNLIHNHTSPCWKCGEDCKNLPDPTKDGEILCSECRTKKKDKPK